MRANPIKRCGKAVRLTRADAYTPFWRRKKRPADVKGRYVWHVTHKGNLRSILRRGLVPSVSGDGEIGKHPPVVFVSKSLKTIKEMAREDYRRTRSGQWVVLRIDTKMLPRVCVFHDPNVPDDLGWLYTRSSIPADAIEPYGVFVVGKSDGRRKR